MVSEMRKKRAVGEFGIESVGIWWLKEEVSENNEITPFAWWGICKKTRKVSFMRLITNTIYAVMPMVMNDILLSEEHGSCDDGKYCLNIDCPYSKNSELIDSIDAQIGGTGLEINDHTVKYFEKVIKFINENFLVPGEELTKEDLDKIFVEGYSDCSVNENAFITSL